jgi:MFS family permease
MQTTAKTASAIIAAGPMSWQQKAIIGLMIGLNALDGFDVMAISFAGPAIAKEWNLSPGIFGWILAMELMGMAVGSIALGRAADRFGRRKTILTCLALMAVGMGLSSIAQNSTSLILSRLLTGLGLGGMLASLTTATAEFSNARRRSLALALVGAGYPLAGVLCGLIAQQVFLSGESWRLLFEIGAVAALVAFVPVALLVPESVAWLERKGDAASLREANRILHSFALEGVTAPLAEDAPPVARLGTGDVPKIIILTLAYFFHVFCYFYFLKWTPKLIVDLGFAPSAAAGAMAVASLGGVLGGVVFGAMANRFGVRRLSVVFLVASGAMINLMGAQAYTLPQMAALVGVMGLLMTAGVVGIFNLAANAFSVETRATSVGIVIGVGRGGSAFAPVVAGYLFAAGFSLTLVSLLMGLASLLAAVAIMRLPKDDSIRA